MYRLFKTTSSTGEIPMRRNGRTAFLILSAALCLALAAFTPARADYFTILRVNPPAAPDAKTDKIKVDIAFGCPFAQTAADMDPLQMFAALRYPEKEGGQIQRVELLDRLKPYKYLGQNAWTSEFSFPGPGLYQFVLETRPYWEEERGAFIQQFAQILVPALGCEYGWELPAGLKIEIAPLTRPFGLNAPALFTGRVLHDGKPLPDAAVYIEYLNEDRRAAPSPHHRTQVVRSAENGIFSFVCPYPGWWGFAARIKGDPLKGSDGQPKESELSGVLWIHVDPPAAPSTKKKGAAR